MRACRRRQLTSASGARIITEAACAAAVTSSVRQKAPSISSQAVAAIPVPATSAPATAIANSVHTSCMLRIRRPIRRCAQSATTRAVSAAPLTPSSAESSSGLPPVRLAAV